MVEKNSDQTSENKEQAKQSIIVEPVGLDLFLGGTRGYLSPEVQNNQDFREQSRHRRELYHTLADTFKRLPDLNSDIVTAHKENKLTPEEISNLYQKLNHFIQEDPNHERLVLYLPFSLFPPKESSASLPEAAKNSQDTFYQTVSKAWVNLLDESDVRASFIDGDILEPALGEPGRIRKAGHLIPFLIPAGVISKELVTEQIEKAKNENDTELLISLQEGWQAWQETMGQGETNTTLTVSEILSTLSEKLIDLDKKFADDTDYVRLVSHKRVVWEKQTRTEEAFDKAARDLAPSLQKGDLDPRLLDRRLSLKTYLYAIEKSQITQKNYNPEHVAQLIQLCVAGWSEGDENIKDTIYDTLCHLKRLNLLDGETSQRFSISTPDLSLPQPLNLEKLVRENYQPLTEAVAAIKADPELSRIICPFFIGVGSQVKGISGRRSDIDAALFWQPGISQEDRQKALDKLSLRCPSLQKIDSMPEVWLAETDGKIHLRPNMASLRNSVTPQQVHFLLGGVWVGDQEAIKKTIPGLIDSYLDLSRLGDNHERARSHLLRRLEMDVLMFRLMHKGFQRTYPQVLDHQAISHIDYESIFYEPEYRQIASQLFVSRVFLPDLDLSQKKGADNSQRPV